MNTVKPLYAWLGLWFITPALLSAVNAIFAQGGLNGSPTSFIVMSVILGLVFVTFSFIAWFIAKKIAKKDLQLKTAIIVWAVIVLILNVFVLYRVINKGTSTQSSSSYSTQ